MAATAPGRGHAAAAGRAARQWPDPPTAVQLGQLVGLGCAAFLGFELLPQLLHLLLRQCSLGLLPLGPRLLVAQLVPLVVQSPLPHLHGPLAGLEFMG